MKNLDCCRLSYWNGAPNLRPAAIANELPLSIRDARPNELKTEAAGNGKAV